MANVAHAALTTVGGIHYVQAWSAANAAERTALSVTSNDVGKVCYQQDTKRFWILQDASGPTWSRIDITSADLGTAATHDVAVATPQPVAGTGAVGVGPKLAFEDHAHAHGTQTDGTMHAAVIPGGASGFMTGADKSKLDGIAASAAALASTAPSSVGTANAVGSGTTAAKADHVHAHGSQTDGTMHAAVVSGGANGFMTGADKAILDGLVTSVAAKADKDVAIRTVAGTTDTLVLADDGKLLQYSNAATVTITVPTNASVAFPVGAQVMLAQYGAGQLILSPAGGVTIRTPLVLKSRTQYSTLVLVKLATDEWLLSGDLASS